MIARVRGSRSCSPKKICERCNLVSLEYGLFRFCLKNDKNIYPLCKIMINYSHVCTCWVGANFRRMLLNGEIWSLFFKRFRPQKILEIFTYCTKVMILLGCPGKLDGAIWSILEYILIKFALKNVIVARYNLLCFGVNFDDILLNKNIQKRISFIQNIDIAASRLLGCNNK